MHELLSSKNHLHRNIYWYVMLCLSIVPFGLTLRFSFDFTTAQFTSLAVLFSISVFVNRYRYTIPGTQTDITAKEMMLFLGVITLGVYAGVFLAVSIALAKLTQFSAITKRKWSFDLFVNASTVFISGTVYYQTLAALARVSDPAFTEIQSEILNQAISLGAMAFVHFWIASIILSSYLSIGNKFEFRRLWEQNFALTASTYFFCAAVVLVFNEIYLRFGLRFLLVTLPVVIVGHLIYRIHVRKLEEMTREIVESSRIHLATVEALATAIDARDQIGVGHVRRTQIYAVGIAEKMGLTSDEIQAVNAGALLHGIGKLAIPDNILNKPGRLTPAEKEKTKVHATVGASIIENIKFPYPVVSTVRHFSEMWVGGGYPDGLAGEEIPITARILSVADAYDTLRGDRPYRAAVSRDQARRILQNGAGTQYDPIIVDIFLRNLSRLESIVESKGLSVASELQLPDSTLPAINIESRAENFVDQIKRANREVFTMYELAKAFSSSLNLEETLAVFAEKIKEQVSFDTCVIYLMNENDAFARAVFTSGKNSVLLENKRIEVGEGATGFVLQNCQPVCDLNPALDFSFDQIEFVEEYTAMASLPLLVDQKLLGAVSIYSCEVENYGDEHLRLVEMVSHIASDAISMALQHAESETRALTDPMTGLPNARSLQIQFEKEVARANRNGSNFQLVMLDLDGFKAVNDTYGHKAGDKLLKELARVMQLQLRDYDFLSRYAGDEFVIIAPETNDAGIAELIERLEKSVANFKLPIDDGRSATVGVSLGASCYPRDGESIDQIIISADKKMYSTKAERKLKQKMPELKVLHKIERPAAKLNRDLEDDNFILELDENDVISSAIN